MGSDQQEQLNDILERTPNLTEEVKTQQRAQQDEMIRAVQAAQTCRNIPPRCAWPGPGILDLRPLTTIRKVHQPILILQGALDRQITVEQAAMLREAAREGGNKDVSSHIFPNLNHLFLPAKTGAFGEYSSLETSVIGDDVLKVLADWLIVRLKVRKG